MTYTLEYDIHEIMPFINWVYFYHTWKVNGACVDGERESLRSDAEDMMRSWDGKYKTYARVSILDAYSKCDDIVVKTETGEVAIPLLRQQKKSADTPYYICLSDFVSPQHDTVALFATAVDGRLEHLYDDEYNALLAQTTCDRLAEATAEALHRDVRMRLWGYAPDENISIEDMLVGHFQGIRPAVGYPSLPDMSVNFILDDVLKMSNIGIRLTENGAMIPHASVSGLMISHPKSFYFNIGAVGDDQLADYAQRRGYDVKDIQRFICQKL